MGLKEAPVPVGPVFVPLIITILVHRALNRKRIEPLRTLSLELAAEIESQHGVSEEPENGEELYVPSARSECECRRTWSDAASSERSGTWKGRQVCFLGGKLIRQRMHACSGKRIQKTIEIDVAYNTVTNNDLRKRCTRPISLH